MSKVVLLVLLAFLQQGGAANVKNLPEIVEHETAEGENEVAGQITVHCPAQPAPSCAAVDHLLLYLSTQDSMEEQLEQLKNKTNSLDGQLQQLAQQELAELQAEADLNYTVEALHATVSSQDIIIQQQAAALQQLQGALQQQANSLQAMETTHQQQEAILQQQGATLQQQGATLQQQEAALQQQGATLQQQEATLQQQGATLQQQEATLQQQGATLQQQEATLQQQGATLQQQEATLQQQEATLQQQTAALQQCTTNLQQLQDKATGPRTCKEILNSGHDTSGVYTIYPAGEFTRPIYVYCDMDTDGGGWTVFQRRKDGSVDFYLDWQNYKTGFGDLGGEFWLGNDNLYHLTAQGGYELRVDLADFEGNSAYAKYSNFKVEDEGQKYKLTVGGYSGTAGDAMADHVSMFFSTKDRDNDNSDAGHCSQLYKGGWWYENCHHANLNGLYLAGRHHSYADGVNWRYWKGFYYSLKHTEMKIRPN